MMMCSGVHNLNLGCMVASNSNCELNKICIFISSSIFSMHRNIPMHTILEVYSLLAFPTSLELHLCDIHLYPMFTNV